MIRVCAVLISALIGCGCGSDPAPPAQTPAALRLFPTADRPGAAWAGCTYTSPLSYGGRIIITESGGTIAALDPETGAVAWSLIVPTAEGEDPVLIAEPAIVRNKLIATYWTTPTPDGRETGSYGHHVSDTRLRHRVVVIDLDTGNVALDFGGLELSATLPAHAAGEVVEFLPNHALSRGKVVHAETGGDYGNVYISFGNAHDIQPWHGWMFEISLDAWLADGADAAVTGVLLTTPEHDCGETGQPGSSSRICGGGLWAPAGPLILEHDAGYDIIAAPGNGQLDLARGDYANTLMRLPRGLAFDPGCDADACADFDPDEPSPACMESCERLFIPRLLPGQAPLKPANGQCDGLTMFECWALMDYIGGSTPVRVDVPGGPAVLAYPAKDGHVYLVDADHLGTLYDRYRAVELCGAPDDPCTALWAGMIVTQPALAWVDGRPIIIVPTFVPDNTHPAGVVALEVVADGGGAKLQPLWTFPDFESDQAVLRFRRHTSRVTISATASGRQIAWIVEAASEGWAGLLTGIDVAAGELFAETPLVGRGMRYSKPLVREGVVYITSCDSDQGPGHIDAYRISE